MTVISPRRIVSLAGAVLAAAALLVAPAAVPAPQTPTAAAADCPDIQVVFARGTTEAVGIGRVGQAFVDALRGQVGGRSVDTYAVSYPASYDFLAAAGGANDASRHIQWMMGACPQTRLVLGGYSQGAAVIDVIAAVPVPGIGFNAPLPPNAPEHVAAIAVFGNPTAKLGLPLTSSPVWGPKAIDLCNGGDPICSDGRSVAAHSDYVASGQAAQAAAFVASRL
ncbi:cutinase family protein [[Mycobacterium] burgundiense]|uniref:Cutinase n=1 Tax=[Mycobacterium] burgundiense TaxID=3064286 RepID=A0ABM9M0X2_9MYCO|nr:cutinase family protein [Mycolicibacterium sp. MU0053]CAJ1508142.1 cutinase family protein [Mycolicibacterium sp. MU0053]